MSMTANFLANFRRILSAGPCMLIKEHGSPYAHVAHPLRRLGDVGYFSQGGASGFYGLNIAPVRDGIGSIRKHGVGGGLEGIRLTGAAADEGVRYLDYFSNGCTTLALDGQARVVFTGPIEGCFVAVGRSHPGTFLFHANENETESDPLRNKLNKIRKIEQAALGYWACRIEELLMASAYSHPVAACRAFVFGVVNGTGDWEFFFHSAIYDGGRWSVKNACEPLPRDV